jgi:formylglycine-generating enzyme required for sulfatase activity
LSQNIGFGSVLDIAYTYRVIRGNSYFAYDYRARVSARSMVTPSMRNNNFIGFRLGFSVR